MFSATDAAFSGFRIARERWKAILVWSAVFAVVSLVAGFLMVSLGGPAMAQFATMTEQTNPDPEEMWRVLSGLAPMLLVMLPLSLVYYGVLYAAVSRIVLRPSDSRTAYLRLGADEFRQIGLLVLLALLLSAVYLGGIVVIVILAGVSAAANQGLAVLVAVLAAVALFCGLIYLMVRLSLCSAQTFDTGRITLFGSWRLTAGRFWPLLGAYLLSFVLYFVVALASMGILMLLVFIVGGGFAAIGTVMSPDMSSLSTFFTPVQIVYYLLSAVVSAFTWLIIGCPPAEIYRQLRVGGHA